MTTAALIFLGWLMADLGAWGAHRFGGAVGVRFCASLGVAALGFAMMAAGVAP